jgi:hypothetical protein
MNIPDEKPRIRVRAGTAADIRSALNKASDHIADLLDVTDAPAFSDQFNVADRGNRARNVVTGPADSMSGSGAERMIQHFSPNTEQPERGLAAAYDAVASQLAFMNTRMAASEAAIKSIATWLAQQAGVKSFPSDETEKADESDEKKGEGDEDEDTAKSIPTMGVPALMRSLSGASRDSGKVGLTAPPSMTVVKARRDSLQDILDQDDGRAFPMHARMELASIQAAMANLDGGQMRDTHLNTLIKRASPQAREALVKANIVF